MQTFPHNILLRKCSAEIVTLLAQETATAEAALLAGIVAGKAYWNVHSSTFGGGEIRGFLVADARAWHDRPRPKRVLGLALMRRRSKA